MRIADTILSQRYLNNLDTLKSGIDKLNSQVATQNKVQTPSDSPEGASKIISLTDKLNTSEAYSKTIKTSLSYIQESILSLENIQSEVTNIQSSLVSATAVDNSQNLDSYADKLKLSLDSILDFANSEVDGKYLFGGTDYSSKPFGYNSDNSAVVVKANDISGEQRVNISSNFKQKINFSGSEIFGVEISQSGTIDSGNAVNATVTTQKTIENSAGEQFTLETTLKKTAANEYELSYDIKDSGNNTIFSSPPDTHKLVFDSSSGRLKTVDGNSKTSIYINNSANKLSFSLDFSGIKEASSNSTSITVKNNNDIFNKLLSIEQNLRNGNKPTKEELEFVESFNKHVLNKIAEAGNITNQLDKTDELLNNQKLIVKDLVSKEKDVDVAEALIELQNHEYLLQLSYKLSSMILPKSLLDYL